MSESRWLQLPGRTGDPQVLSISGSKCVCSGTVTCYQQTVVLPSPEPHESLKLCALGFFQPTGLKASVQEPAGLSGVSLEGP